MLLQQSAAVRQTQTQTAFENTVKTCTFYLSTTRQSVRPCDFAPDAQFAAIVYHDRLQYRDTPGKYVSPQVTRTEHFAKFRVAVFNIYDIEREHRYTHGQIAIICIIVQTKVVQIFVGKHATLHSCAITSAVLNHTISTTKTNSLAKQCENKCMKTALHWSLITVLVSTASALPYSDIQNKTLKRDFKRHNTYKLNRI